MRKNIESLIKSSISAYRVAKDTGLPRSPITRLFTSESKIDNVTLKNAEILSKYWEELKMIKIEKKNNHEHIIGEEFEREYTVEELEGAKSEIEACINDFTDFINLNGNELEDWEQEEVDNLESLKDGSYDLNCGDYTYYIEVKLA